MTASFPDMNGLSNGVRSNADILDTARLLPVIANYKPVAVIHFAAFGESVQKSVE